MWPLVLIPSTLSSFPFPAVELVHLGRRGQIGRDQRERARLTPLDNLEQALVNGACTASAFDLGTVKLLMTIFLIRTHLGHGPQRDDRLQRVRGSVESIKDWQGGFRHVDRDRSGGIDLDESSLSPKPAFKSSLRMAYGPQIESRSALGKLKWSAEPSSHPPLKRCTAPKPPPRCNKPWAMSRIGISSISGCNLGTGKPKQIVRKVVDVGCRLLLRSNVGKSGQQSEFNQRKALSSRDRGPAQWTTVAREELLIGASKCTVVVGRGETRIKSLNTQMIVSKHPSRRISHQTRFLVFSSPGLIKPPIVGQPSRTSRMTLTVFNELEASVQKD
ncbi:hypothetical protein DFH09DRAFT_1095444 [Mycena vulgaris]|nr:hypothetical protein DFH09DRAFT_1095444 [Mycena vulgaris]